MTKNELIKELNYKLSFGLSKDKVEKHIEKIIDEIEIPIELLTGISDVNILYDDIDELNVEIVFDTKKHYYVVEYEYNDKKDQFMYKNKKYMFCELREPHWCNNPGLHDIIAIFEIKNDEYIFVNYFYGAAYTSKEEAIEIAKEYIDEK